MLRRWAAFSVTLPLPVSSHLTVPKNFPQELRKYTIQGFRVIAFAHKDLKMKKLSEVENLAR